MDKYLRPSFFWDIGYKALGTENMGDLYTNVNTSDYTYMDKRPGLKAVTYQGNQLAIQRVDTEIEFGKALLEPMRVADNNRLTILFTDCEEFECLLR